MQSSLGRRFESGPGCRHSRYHPQVTLDAQVRARLARDENGMTRGHQWQAIAALRAIAKMHRPLGSPRTGQRCAHCPDTTWPCPTYQALADGLQISGT